jgi:hypothetical protein
MITLFVCGVLSLSAEEAENTRLKDSFNVMKEVLGIPDKGIPQACWTKRSAW